jgi:hypothetical protein
VSKLVDTETFPVLIQQVHQAFGGPSEELLENVLDQKVEDAEEDVEANVSLFSFDSSPTVSKEPITVDPVDETALILETAFEKIEELQEQLDNAVIDASAGAMPFDFASHAAPILDTIAKSMKKIPDAEQILVQQQVGARIQQLYQEQLTSLRDYYGRLFESTLREGGTKQATKHAADKVVEQFRKAASAAVPARASAFGSLDLDYLRATAADGLEADIDQLLDLRREAIESDSDMDEANTGMNGTLKKQSVPTWYKKLAARGLVLGINYFQAWLAWQGIKRAALQREKNLPKFPLF